MIWIVIFALSLLVGLVVGRWWALAAAVVFGAYIAVESDVEAVPPVVLGLIYAIVAAVGIAAGVFARRLRTR